MITIKESNEKLVNIQKTCPEFVFQLDNNRIQKEGGVFVRKTIVQKLKKAKRTLPEDMTFVIRDAWRSSQEQKNIYTWFIQYFSRMHPGWGKQKVKEEVERFVAPYKGKWASGHMTGGAIDIRLWKKGRKVPMRSKKLTYKENAQSIQPKLPSYIRRNREILRNALESVDMYNYPHEFWHWSYGDIHWAKGKGKSEAIYGISDKK